MSIEITELSCCGISEIHGVDELDKKKFKLDKWEEEYRNTPKDILRVALDRSAAYFIFSSTNSGGVIFAKYIRARQKGSVTRLKRQRNPNSGKMLDVYIWYPNLIRRRKRR